MSNWLEAENLILKVEEVLEEGMIHISEVFMFTDNTISEGFL